MHLIYNDPGPMQAGCMVRFNAVPARIPRKLTSVHGDGGAPVVPPCDYTQGQPNQPLQMRRPSSSSGRVTNASPSIWTTPEPTDIVSILGRTSQHNPTSISCAVLLCFHFDLYLGENFLGGS